MHAPGLIPILIVLALAFLLFGRPGKISNLMQDLGKGIRGFKDGLSGDDDKEKSAGQIVDRSKKDDDRSGA
jgi:sec-independent protein translocase protein TatA